MATQVSYTPVTLTDYVGIGGFYAALGQSFAVTGDDVALTDIQLALSVGRNASDIGNLTVRVYAANGSGLPTGNVLSSGTIAATSVNSGNRVWGTTVWTSITMEDYALASGTSYVWTITPDNPGDVYSGRNVFVWGSSTAGYSRGVPGQYASGWEASSLIGDFSFKINGDVAGGFVDVSGTITFTVTVMGTAYEAFDPPVATGLNFMSPIRRLVAAAANAIYYEDI